MKNDLVFWAKCWRSSRDLFRSRGYVYRGVPDMAEANYAFYLTEVFSFLFEKGKVQR
jgi:hypothetical protein